MFTILGSDGKEYGPVTADKLREWIAGGRANGQTKVRRAGETEWKLLAEIPELAQPGSGGDLPPPATAVAGTPGPVAAAVPQSHPVIPVPMTGDASTIAADLINRSPKIDVFDCLARSFDLWKNNFWPLVGVTLLIFLVQGIIGFIPLLGMVARILLNGVFAAGLYYYYIGKIRSEPREVGDAFAGFSKGFVPLMAASVLITVLTMAVILPSAAPFFFFLIKAALHQHPVMPVFTPVLFLGCAVGGLLALFLSISWTFTFALIIDKNVGPWTAMEVSRRVVARQWFRVFFVVLLGGILTALGLIGLIIGVLFTLPLMIGAILYAYEDMCNPPAPRA